MRRRRWGARPVVLLLALAAPWSARAEPRLEPRFEPGVSEAGFFPREPDEAPPAPLAALLAAARRSETDALLVLHRGRVVAERYFGRPASDPIDVWSVTKSVVGLGVLQLLGRGRIPSLETPLHRWLPALATGRRARITLHHVLTHTSGLARRGDLGVLWSQPDRVAYVERLPLVSEPGRVFAYSNEAVQLLARVVARASGVPLDVWLDRELFRPLGIVRWRWARDRAGQVPAFSGLHLTARDLGRIGQLLLDGGRWQGRELVPAAWLARATAPQPPPAAEAGLLFWIRRERGRADGPVVGYYARGWLGQYLLVYPRRQLVVVRLHRTRHGGGLDENRRAGFPSLFRLAEALLP